MKTLGSKGGKRRIPWIRWPLVFLLIFLGGCCSDLSWLGFLLPKCCSDRAGGCCEDQCESNCVFHPIEKRIPKKENPRFWVFDATVPQIQACFTAPKDSAPKDVSITGQYGDEIYFYAEFSGDYSVTLKGPGTGGWSGKASGPGFDQGKVPEVTYSSRPRRKPKPYDNDLYLMSNSESPNAGSRPSWTYFRCGKPLGYTADYQLHLTSEDGRRTKVEVWTVSSWVHAYTEYYPYGAHGWRNRVYSAIPPEGIREYKILRLIGACLGTEEKMPPLNLPEGDLIPCPECPQGLR